MLGTIRHFQKTILIVVTVLIIIAFAFLYSDYDFAKASFGSNANCVIKVGGRCYRPNEALKLTRYQGLAANLGMRDFVNELSGPTRTDKDPTDFVLNLLALRETGKKMGVEPSEEEVIALAANPPILKNQAFDSVRSGDFLRNILGQTGLQDTDLQQVTKDYLTFNKLKDLVTAGIQPVPAAAENRYIQANQRYSTRLIDFRRENFIDQVEVTDEEIKTYYNARNGVNKGQPEKDPVEGEVPVAGENPVKPMLLPLLTNQKRSFNFLKFTKRDLGEGATQEAVDKADYEFRSGVNDIYSELTERGVDVMEVSKAVAARELPYDVEQGVFETFDLDTVPEKIKSEFRLLSQMFSGGLTLSKVDVPREDAAGSFYIYQLKEIVEPREKTLEEAREQIIAKLTERKSDTLANEKATVALTKLEEAMKAGKTLEAAAAEEGLTVVNIPTFSAVDREEDLEDGFLISRAVAELSAGELSKVTERSNKNGYFISLVDKVEIYKDEKKAETLEDLNSRLVETEKVILFRAWLKKNFKEIGAERPRDPNGNPISLLNIPI